MICLVRLIVAAVCGLLIGVERQTRMKGAGPRTHMMVSLGAALMTLVSSYGFLPIVGAAGVSVDVSRVAASIAAGILGAGVIYVHRGGVVGLTDGKGDLVRLYDWLAQRKITVREIALKRQEGNSVKSCCTLPCRGISIKRISCGCRRISRVCSRLKYKRNSKAVRQKCRTAFVLDE